MVSDTPSKMRKVPYMPAKSREISDYCGQLEKLNRKQKGTVFTVDLDKSSNYYFRISCKEDILKKPISDTLETFDIDTGIML